MVPPDALFGTVPTWVGVYALAAIGFSIGSIVLYRRVLRLVMLGRPAGRLDRPLHRLLGAVPPTLGQSKVLQSVSLRDRAGLAHVFIFWGFLSFVLSYVIFIFSAAAWAPFSKTLLTETGVRVYAVYPDLLAVGFLVVLVWAVARRWMARPAVSGPT